MNALPTGYHDRVLGCWMGKNIGGTLGAPFEFIRQINDVSFYTQDLGGEPLPNDDLDLQLLWLIAMEERGPRLDAHTLAEYWCLYVTPHWSEYGTAKINLRRGLPPPWSGTFGNEFRHSCGAFIRSEIWACLAPGRPDLAAQYAIEDAIVDHGDGEGTWGEVFFAALESAAFVCNDLRRLIEIGLSYVPAESGVAGAVRCAIECHTAGKSWRESRDEILRGYRGSTLFGLLHRTSPEDRAKGFHEGRIGYDAPSNVALAVLALLEGQDDFGRVVTTAVNCGEDTDCTAATAGAVFGLMRGIAAIPQKWISPIGRRIKTISLNLGELGPFGAQVPATVDALTDRTERMARRVLETAPPLDVPFSTPAEVEKARDPIADLYAPESLRQDLIERVHVARYRFDFFAVDVQTQGAPAIRNGEVKSVRFILRNTYKTHACLSLRWHVPPGWRAEPANAAVTVLPPVMSGPRVVPFTLHAGEVVDPVVRCPVEIAIQSRPTVMIVPVILANANA